MTYDKHWRRNFPEARSRATFEDLYFWRDVMAPVFTVVRPEWIMMADMDRETNAEVRRVMFERYRHGEEIHGAAAFLRDAGPSASITTGVTAPCGGVTCRATSRSSWSRS